MIDSEPLDGELALPSHWVAMSKAEILKIVKVIACVVGFGVLGAGIGIPAAGLAAEMGALGGGGGAVYGGYDLLFGFMFMGGVIGAVFGRYIAQGGLG